MIVAPANVNSYTTIGDATAGDKIYFIDAAAIETFVSSAVTLAGSAAFLDYANAAVNGLTTVGKMPSSSMVVILTSYSSRVL